MKKNTLKLLSFMFCFAICAVYSYAQTSFSNYSYLLNADIYSGGPVAVADMNGDFLDDIVCLNQTADLMIEYQNADGSFTFFDGGSASTNAWALCVADTDNDGIAEIITGGAYNEMAYLKPTANGFSRSVLNGPSLFVQGTNFADVNNDGYVDAFSCHDDGPNRLWINDGAGNLNYSSDMIDFSLFDTEEENAGNYGSVWTDFDRDGDLDLYIAKCRQGVNNMEDVRRINQLWINDGNNNYTENAAAYNLNINWQSWTAEFQDIDNDGDFDCFITNHDHESQLLENVNGIFNDITAESGLEINGLPIQAAMKDFDNDGFMDIIVAGYDINLYFNNGDKTFTKADTNGEGDGLNSFGLGDLNHDGFIDIYATYGGGLNGSTSKADELLLNNTNGNNFLAVNLMGTESNRNAIGALLELKGAWGTMIREVRSGESYGIGNSFTQHFGLGAHEDITSLTIHWPSGVSELLDDIEINQFITVLEQECTSPPAAIVVDGSTTFCSGGSVNLSAPPGYNYTWSNNATTASITVSEAGIYSVTVADDSDCLGISQNIVVTVDPEESIAIELIGEETFCEGDQTVLSVTDAVAYLWSTGETTQSITVNESGIYMVSAQGTCEALEPQSIEITVLPTPSMPTAMDASIPAPGTAMLTAEGDNLYWYDAATEGNLIGQGNTIETPYITHTAYYHVEDVNETSFSTANGGEAMHTGTSLYSNAEFHGSIIFDCYEAFILKTIRVYTDTPGERVIELQSANGTVLQSRTIGLKEGENIITLDFSIEPDENLILTTNEDHNIATFGNVTPRLQRTSTNGGGSVDYPYTVGAYALMKNSNFGTDWYYYFYDWKVESSNIKCSSPRTAVEVVVESSVNTYDINASDALKVYPNPTSDYCLIEVQAGNEFQYQLLDVTGRQVLRGQLDAKTMTTQQLIDLTDQAKGLYYLQFKNEQNTYTTKVVLQ